MTAQPDWSSPTWLASASQWIQEQARHGGLTGIKPPEQILISLWSTVLRVTTTTETLYFKASVPFFAYEPALTLRLSQLAPAHTPEVLSIDQTRHWILMRDAGTPLSALDDKRTALTYWEEVLQSYAQMQIHLLDQQDTLLAAGCPDRRLNLLPALLEDALSHTSLLQLGQEQGLPEDDYMQLRQLTPQVKELSHLLKSHGIPETLHHDDLHAGNILFNGHKTIFFDWAESAITHPFCSMVIVERVFRHILKFPPEVIAQLRDSYKLFSMDVLRFSELERSIEGVTQKMLIQQLKELEKDGLVRRVVYPQVPPKVEYSLTEIGHALTPALIALMEWAELRQGGGATPKSSLVP